VKDKQLLQTLKTQLSQYKTFDCKLRHEQIINVEFNASTDHAGIPLQPITSRVGFCSRDARNQFVSCAHTTAAVNFKSILDNIKLIAEFDKFDSFKQSIEALTTQIYVLDHKKGDFEKQYAYAKFNDKPLAECEKIKTMLNQTVETHSSCVQQLELLRQAIMNELDKILYSSDSSETINI